MIYYIRESKEYYNHLVQKNIRVPGLKFITQNQKPGRKEQMKIYVGKDITGYLKASLSLDTMMRYACDGNIITGNVPLIHNAKVYMIQVYYGYDKDERTGENEDVINLVGPFYSVSSAESSDSWKTLETVASCSGIPYVKAKGFLAQKNADGSLFRHGDISNDLFNARVIGIRVI